MQILRCKIKDFLVYLQSAFCIALVLLFFESSASANCQWIDAVGEASGENLTPDEAKQFAINKARLSAIESKVGVGIVGGSFLENFRLMADIVQTVAQGYIIEEKIEEWQAVVYQNTKESFPLINYRVKLKACVAGAGEKDPYFRITARLNKEVFSSGEEVKIKISASYDSFINIFNLTADDRLKIIAPTTVLPLIPIKKDENLSFPPEGFGLPINMVPEKRRATECFIIVATRQPFNFASLIGKTKDITIPEFYRAIVSIPSREKAEGILLYEVVASRR